MRNGLSKVVGIGLCVLLCVLLCVQCSSTAYGREDETLVVGTGGGELKNDNDLLQDTIEHVKLNKMQILHEFVKRRTWIDFSVFGRPSNPFAKVCVPRMPSREIQCTWDKNDNRSDIFIYASSDVIERLAIPLGVASSSWAIHLYEQATKMTALECFILPLADKLPRAGRYWLEAKVEYSGCDWQKGKNFIDSSNTAQAVFTFDGNTQWSNKYGTNSFVFIKSNNMGFCENEAIKLQDPSTNATDSPQTSVQCFVECGMAEDDSACPLCNSTIWSAARAMFKTDMWCVPFPSVPVYPKSFIAIPLEISISQYIQAHEDFRNLDTVIFLGDSHHELLGKVLLAGEHSLFRKSPSIFGGAAYIQHPNFLLAADYRTKHRESRRKLHIVCGEFGASTTNCARLWSMGNTEPDALTPSKKSSKLLVANLGNWEAVEVIQDGSIDVSSREKLAPAIDTTIQNIVDLAQTVGASRIVIIGTIGFAGRKNVGNRYGAPKKLRIVNDMIRESTKKHPRVKFVDAAALGDTFGYRSQDACNHQELAAYVAIIRSIILSFAAPING